MRLWKIWLPVTLAVVLASTWAVAQQFMTANQGAPGKFGPWPVTVVMPVGSGIPVTPQLCLTNIHKNTAVGGAAVSTPAAQLAGRRMIVLCNSLQNAGNPTVKCRVDGVLPILAATNPGDVLGRGDCILYAIPDTNIPKCISSGAAVNVISSECL